MSNVLKVAQNRFYFTGKVIVNDKTFTINKTNESGTWVHNSLNMGIDCGQDSGINYVSLMGGYNPTRDNFLYVATIDSEGKTLGKDAQKKIAWNDRLDIPEEDWKTFSSVNVLKCSIEVGEDEKLIHKQFLSAYDMVAYLKEHLTNDTYVTISGHMEFNLDRTDSEHWITSHVIDSISLANPDNTEEKALVNLSAIVDKGTIGKPNAEDKTIPLFVRTTTFVNKYNGNKYNQVCTVPMKLIWDFTGKDFNDQLVKNTLAAAVNEYFTAKDNMASEILLRCHYRGGAKQKELKKEDFSQQVQQAIETGIMSKDEYEKQMATDGSVVRELVFDSVAGQIVDNTLKIRREADKYKQSELPEFKDLKPIETAEDAAAPVSPRIDDTDPEVNSEVDSILAMFNQ